MADGPTGPSFDTSLAYRQAMAGNGGSGCAPILMGLRDVQFTNFKLPAGICSADGMVQKLPQARPGPIASLLKSMGFSGPEVLAGMSKVAQAGAVREASITEITGQSHGLGRSFSGGSDIGIG